MFSRSNLAVLGVPFGNADYLWLVRVKLLT